MKHTDGEGFKVVINNFPFMKGEFQIKFDLNCLGGEDAHWLDHSGGNIQLEQNEGESREFYINIGEIQDLNEAQ